MRLETVSIPTHLHTFPAKPRCTDVSHILGLIHELAAYEHATSSVEATETTLLDTLAWADSPSSHPSASGYARTLLLRVPESQVLPSTNKDHSYASSHGEVVGMALYFTNYSTWRAAPGVYLEDLYVRPEYRKRGYGLALIKALAAETQRIGGKRLEWSCLKWNEPSLKFYRALGAKEMSDWVGLRVDGEALEKLSSATS